MKLVDLFESDFGDTDQKTINDRHAQKQIDDTRKPKITLARINKLRKLRELKKFQELKRDSLINIMYGEQGDAGF
jgi:hypothetical protein